MNPEEERADPARSSGLLIGNGTYTRSDFPALPATDKNLNALEREFKDAELWGLRRGSLEVERDVDRRDFLSLIEGAARKSDPDGIFVFYFFGHAEKYRGKLYLAPSDADRGNPEHSMISISDVFRTVDALNGAAQRKLAILDCCYAGSGIKEAQSEPMSAAEAKGWYVMAATSATATALADPERTHSLFTSALLKTFQGVAETRRSLSPHWVFENASKLIEGLRKEITGSLPIPYHSPAEWGDAAWLRNRQHIEAPHVPYKFSMPLPEDVGTNALPYGFRPWPTADPLFVGRTNELRQAKDRLRPRSVLRVEGPPYTGKEAFVRQLLSSQEVAASGPAGHPWLLLEIAVANASAELPVLEALASALEVRLQDVNTEARTGRDPRLELVMEKLKGCARGSTLLLVIECGRLGYDSKQVRGELNRLLEDPYFRATANVVISRAPLEVDGSGELYPQPRIHLQELERQDAAELLTSLLLRAGVNVDGATVLDRIQDRRMLLPGVLNISASGFLDSAQGRLPAPEPSVVAEALLEGSAASVARTLRELGCTIDTSAESAAQTLAVLVVWALTENLALPAGLLEQVGAAPRTIKLLKDARVLFDTADGLLGIGQVSRQALRSLLLAALTREQAADDPLASRPLDGELDKLFTPHIGLEKLDLILTRAASALTLTSLTLRPSEEGPDRDLLQGLRWAVGWIEDEGAGRLPQLHGSLGRVLLAYAGDAPFLPMLSSISDTVDNTIAAEAAEDKPKESPPTAGEQDVPTESQQTILRPSEPTIPDQLSEIYQLHHAVAALTLAARATGTFVKISAAFVAAAEHFADSFAVSDPEMMPHSLLRSADISLALTGERLSLSPRLLDVRLRAVDALIGGAHRQGPGQAGRVTLAISWLLNTSEILIETGDLPAARDLIQQAADLIEHTLPNDGSFRSRHTRLQFRSRIARARSRCATDPEDRRREALKAVENGVTGMELARVQGQSIYLWARRTIESGFVLIQCCSDDDQLQSSVDLVMKALERCWEGQHAWPLQVRIMAAGLLQKSYSRCLDLETRYRGVSEAVQLLTAAAPAIPAVTDTPSPKDRTFRSEIVPVPVTDRGSAPDDSEAPATAQEIGEIFAALGQAHGRLASTLRVMRYFDRARQSMLKAEEYARAAVTVAPGTFTYSVWLRCVLQIHRSTTRASNAKKQSERRWRSCTREIQRWLNGQEDFSHEHALLNLRCLQAVWLEEGSLRAISQEPDEDFLFLPAKEKQSRIYRHYQARLNRLNAHRHRYGDSADLCIIEAQLERDYRRWSAVTDYAQSREPDKRPQKRPRVDNSSVIQLFSRAMKIWPGHLRLRFAEANFYRYIWEDRQALRRYERIARTARSGDILKQSSFLAAEVMLAILQHEASLGAEDREKLLVGARDYLSVVTGDSKYFDRAAVLREQVSLQLGEEVEWGRIDAAFENIVGGDYAGTIGRYMDRQHYGHAADVNHLFMRARIVERRGSSSPEQRELRATIAKFRLQGSTEGGAWTSDGLSKPNPIAESAPMQEQASEAAYGVAELLLDDFTSIDLLQGMGNIYLLRAEKLLSQRSVWEKNDEATSHARRAYDCFEACRMLQEARSSESIVTKFLRGKAITSAADASCDPDPFPWRGKKLDRTLLAEGHRLLWAARSASVGRFNKVCSRALFHNRELQKRLGTRPSWTNE